LITLKEIKEGKARLLIPDPSTYSKDGKFDPSWAPIFYNPRMVLNRDISVVITKLAKVRRALDAFTASGVRGIRYALEGGVEEVSFNDRNVEALQLAQKNAELNQVKGKFLNLDARAAMLEGKYDFIDVDPFGTPAPFLVDSTWAIKRNGILGITATDLTALEGAAPKACRRKYGALNEGLTPSKEVGLRILVGSLIKSAAIAERTIEPLLCYYSDHYIRLFVKVISGAKRADGGLESLGCVAECPSCLYAVTSDQPIRTCPRCGGRMKVAGPLWLGRLNEPSLLGQILKEANSLELPSIGRIVSLMTKLEKEIVYIYRRLDKLSSIAHVSMPSRDKFYECLRGIGREVTATHFDQRGFKTNATYEEIISCLRSQS
jgi:tRNA (guanine26-N2/guanine27-N2)-dimethyltransferase